MADQSPHINDLLKTYREGGEFPSYDQLAAIAGQDQVGAAVRGEGVANNMLQTWPAEIWLQGGTDEVEEYPGMSEDLTWCSESIHKSDVPYVRADLVSTFSTGATYAPFALSARAADALDSQPTVAAQQGSIADDAQFRELLENVQHENHCRMDGEDIALINYLDSRSSSAPVAPIAPDAVRNAALEDAARLVEDYQAGNGTVSFNDIAHAIRGLAAPQQEGSEAGNG